MPLRRTAYRWQVSFDDPLMAQEVYDDVLDVITRWCQLKPTKFSDGWVRGAALGVLEVGILCTARDQWQAHANAMKFAKGLAVNARVSVRQLYDPDPATLDPHKHRGRWAILAPKYQEMSDGTSAASGDSGEPVRSVDSADITRG
jgi:hypothetical protein